jgi:hypothetical protein
MNKLQKIWLVLTNKRLPVKATYNFTSNFKIDELAKGKFHYISMNILIDEVGDYWLENVKILSPDSKKQKNQYFVGSVGDLLVLNRNISKEEAQKLFKE